MHQVLCHHNPAEGEHHRLMLVISRYRCSSADAHRRYFSPRMVIFWCLYQHRERRAEYTPHQYHFARVDIYQPMFRELKVKDFWIHRLLSQECSCPQSCLDSLPLCWLLFLSTPSQGYKDEPLDYHSRPGVRIYLCYTPDHSTRPMECEMREAGCPNSSRWVDFCCDLAASSAEHPKWSPCGLSLCRLRICFRTYAPSNLLTDKRKSLYSIAGLN